MKTFVSTAFMQFVSRQVGRFAVAYAVRVVTHAETLTRGAPTNRNGAAYTH